MSAEHANSGPVVVVGGGIGGLTTAAALARQGIDVTVLEAHVYVGGCAGTFYHQGYRFEAGATLAGGFYPGGPMDQVATAAGIDAWPARHDAHAMRVHLPDGRIFDRLAGDERWAARREAFGARAETFWRWQEATADALWDLALRLPAWPPQNARDLIVLLRAAGGWLGQAELRKLPGLIQDAFRPVSAHLAGADERLRLTIDGQLLISAQATSDRANALYGASALDLPRRGVVHLRGGMGAIAETLAEAIVAHGGRVLRRQEAERIVFGDGRPIAVETRRGDRFPADRVIVNLPPWNLLPLLGDAAPAWLRRLPPRPTDGWGAFTVYVGLAADALPASFPLHHQLLRRRPLGEGNSLFLSLSPTWDQERAPAGRRALTISTHTDLARWWRWFDEDRAAYEEAKRRFADDILAAAETVIPGLRDAADLVLPGTPVTFQRFTRRRWGWVGGFPQVSLLRARGPRVRPGVWMVGDSIFPGQSTAAVALGGLRVADQLLSDMPQGGRQTEPGIAYAEITP